MLIFKCVSFSDSKLFGVFFFVLANMGSILVEF